MKIKVGLIGLAVMILTVTFIFPAEVEATNCYYLYYNCSCFNYDWESWDYTKLALHRDGTWEGGNTGTEIYGGMWGVFGNAIFMDFEGTNEGAPACFSEDHPFFGTKTGTVKFDILNPRKAKANIKKAQGYFEPEGCWYLKKVKNTECPWISEE